MFKQGNSRTLVLLLHVPILPILPMRFTRPLQMMHVDPSFIGNLCNQSGRKKNEKFFVIDKLNAFAYPQYLILFSYKMAAQ